MARVGPIAECQLLISENQEAVFPLTTHNQTFFAANISLDIFEKAA